MKSRFGGIKWFFIIWWGITKNLNFETLEFRLNYYITVNNWFTACFTTGYTFKAVYFVNDKDFRVPHSRDLVMSYESEIINHADQGFRVNVKLKPYYTGILNGELQKWSIVLSWIQH